MRATVLGLVLTAVVAAASGPGLAQQRDFSKTQIKTTKIAGNLYTLAGFDAVIKLARTDTRIIPGHGPVVDKTAVAAHKDMMIAVRDKVAALVRQNKSQEEVVAARPTSEFDAKVTGATAATADRFVGQLYQELKAAR